MFDRFEGHDDIESAVGQRQGVTGTFDKANALWRAVTGVSVRDRGCIDVDTDRFGSYRAYERCAVTFAAGCVEHAFAGGEATRECIAVPMLIRDFAGAARGGTRRSRE